MLSLENLLLKLNIFLRCVQNVERKKKLYKKYENHHNFLNYTDAHISPTVQLFNLE